jgi:Tol biopolymer transport system component
MAMGVKTMENYIKKGSNKSWVIWLIVGLLLIRCSPNEQETETVPAAADVVTTIRATAVTTATNSPSATPIPPKLTNTPLPTPTSTPSPTPVPTGTPTTSPWLFEDLSQFFFYNAGDDLYRVRTNGERQLVTTATIPSRGQPWSPDGLKFFYSIPSLSNAETAMIADLITGQTQRLDILTTGSGYWSPDGKYLLYTYINEDPSLNLEDRSLDLMVYSFENLTSRLLIKIPRPSGGSFIPIAGWSPDSRHVAFAADLDGQQDLYKIDIETSELQRLTNSPELEIHVAWSPVADQLVLGTNSDPFALSGSFPFAAEDLRLIDDNGQQLRYIGEFDELVSVSWSPDGQQIAYSEDGKMCIYHLTDGITTCLLEETILTSAEWATAFYSPVAWSADGNWLAFQSIEIGELQCHRTFIFDLRNNIVVDPIFPSCTFSNISWSRAVP